jgi:hypothetical protein
MEVPKYLPLPAACSRLVAIDLPDGSTAQDVIEAQATAIVQYEKQIEDCAK